MKLFLLFVFRYSSIGLIWVFLFEILVFPLHVMRVLKAQFDSDKFTFVRIWAIHHHKIEMCCFFVQTQVWMNPSLHGIFKKLNYMLKYVFRIYKYQNVWNISLQNFEFFFLKKLKSIIFWPNTWPYMSFFHWFHWWL